VGAVTSQICRFIECENKESVQESCVDALFKLSERHDVESIEDHLYICPESSSTSLVTTTTTTTRNNVAVLSAEKVSFFVRRMTKCIIQ